MRTSLSPISSRRRGISLVAVMAAAGLAALLVLALTNLFRSAVGGRALQVRNFKIEERLNEVESILAHSQLCRSGLELTGPLGAGVGSEALASRVKLVNDPFLVPNVPIDNGLWSVTELKARTMASVGPIRTSGVVGRLLEGELVVSYQFANGGGTLTGSRAIPLYFVTDGGGIVRDCFSRTSDVGQSVAICSSIGGKLNLGDPDPNAATCVLLGEELTGLQFAGTFQTGLAGTNDGFHPKCEAPHPLTGFCRCPPGFQTYSLGRICERDFTNPPDIVCDDASGRDWDEHIGCYRDGTF